MSIPLRQTISAEALRSRILATVSESPALTAYEVAAVLGYGKPESRRVAEIVQRLWDDGALVADNAFRPAMGRQARIFFVAPAGTRPRRARNRAGKPGAPRGAPHLTTLRPAAASIGRDSERAACRDADPELFFGPGSEWPKARARRVAKARAYCFACPIRLACLDVAQSNGETWGVWGGADLETERAERSPKAARPGAGTPSRT